MLPLSSYDPTLQDEWPLDSQFPMALMIQKVQMTVICVGAQFLSRRTSNRLKINMHSIELKK